jgi:hypothetical protein
MVKLVNAAVAAGFLLAMAAPAFAADAPKTEKACKKAKGTWDATAKTCTVKK